MHSDHHTLHSEADIAHDVWGSAPQRTLCFVSQKGGVAKTTSAVNLAACFALSGHRVLLIGTDPQCGVSASFGCSPDQLRGGLREVVLSGLPLADVAHATELDNLSFVVPDVWTLQEEEQYKSLMQRQADLFVRAVHEAREDYDTILIDCPPGFGPETRAALMASDGYLVPVQAEELCRSSLERLLRFIDDFQTVQSTPLDLEGLFLTMTDHRTLLSRSVAAQLDERFGRLLFDASVPRTTRLAEMAVQGRPTVIYDRRASGSRAYFDLMDEILLRRLSAGATATQSPTAPKPAVAAPKAPPAERSAAAGLASFGASDKASAGLMRLLGELGGGTASHTGLPPELDDEDDPDLVSLDELLAEEESDEDREDEAGWGYGEDSYGTIN